MRKHKDYDQVSMDLSVAFEYLSKHGFFAKRFHGDCSTCGWAETPDKPKNLNVAFTHDQDEEDLKKTGEIYIAYGSANGPERGEDKRAKAAGEMVCKALRAAGLDCVWDGNTKTRIMAKAFR